MKNPPTLPRMECRYSPHETEVDGSIEKVFWNAAEWQPIDKQWNGSASDPQWETAFASRWTDQFVYFAFRTHFFRITVANRPVTQARTHELWAKEDVVEIFLAPDVAAISHYKEFELSPSGQWIDIEIRLEQGYKDFNWSSGMESNSVLNLPRKLWCAEFRIPRVSFAPSVPGLGSEVGLNAYRVELASSLHLTWSPTLTPKPNFHYPDRFGRLRLV